MGGRCSSARSLVGRRFSSGLVGRGRASEGTCRIFGGRRRALADSPPRDRWPGGLGTSSLLYIYPSCNTSLFPMFEFLIPFHPSFHLGRNPILPRTGFLLFWCLTGWGRTFVGAPCIYPTRVTFLFELLTPFPPYFHLELVLTPVMFPRARRPGAGLQGIALDLRRAGGAPPQDRRPGGNWYVVPLYLSYSFSSI